MKKLLFFVCAFAIWSACAPPRHASHPNGVPPGQAKKAAGTKSAKPFAPGQQKKH